MSAERSGDRIVGIDLGTSNTVVAIVDELEHVQVLADADGHTVHPSVVSFHPNGGVVVGVSGKQRKVLDPKNTIYSAKRMIGQPFRSFAVTETARRVPFEIKEGPNEQAIVVTRTGEFAIPEISAIVLDHVRKIASSAIRSEVARAVVTVPASFTDVQRASTAAAGALAGLTVVRVLNEPTAAALAYGSTKRLDEIIAVYDFGGGTFDITILKLDDQVYTVLGTSGDAFLGGEDMDERIVERMVKSFFQEHRIDLRTDDISMMRLRAVAEHTKIELSRRSRAVLKVEEVANAPDGTALDLSMQLTRDELVASIGDLVERTFVSCKEAMTLAGVSPDRIADVILVGGTTRIPYVREQVTRFFRKSPRTDMNPEDAIATGAALQASSIEQMLARAPQRPMASVPIPVDDLLGEVLFEPVRVEPEPTRSRIAEVKRPKRGTDMFGRPREPLAPPIHSNAEPALAKVAARTQAMFGDLFGDKPSGPPSARARPARQSGDLDWEPPAGSAFFDDDEIDAEDIVELAATARAAPPRLANVDDIAIEVVEPSIPEIRLDDVDDEIEVVLPTRSGYEGQDEIAVEIDAPEVAKRAPRDLDWDPKLANEIVIPTTRRETTLADNLELAAPQRGPALALDLDEPQSHADMQLGHSPSRRPPPELDWDSTPHAQPIRAATARAEPPPPVPVAPPPAPSPRPRTPTRRPAAVIDVTSRGLGIGTVAGFCEELIRRNSQLPAAIRRSFVTSRDAQETVRIVICQGESRRVENNLVIGDLVLPNLPRRARGETRIDVEFVLDASCILHVSARDAATGAEQRAKLDLKGGMAPEDMHAASKRLQELSNMAAG